MTQASSEAAYEKVYARLANAIRQRRTLPTPTELADEIAARDLRVRSAKFYAASVRHVLSSDPLALSEFNTRWEDVRPLTRTGNQRKLEVSREALIAIRKAGEARAAKSKYAAYVCDLIEGVIIFGLRPSEWSEACWANDAREVLVVRNGKFHGDELTRGPFAGRKLKRGNGRMRYLRLTGSEPVKDHARHLVERIFVHEQATPWSKSDRYLQRELKQIVEYAIAHHGLPARYRNLTIYMARHEFAATAKGAVSIEGGEVAALMGHVSIKTALRSYARHRKGNSWRLAVEPEQKSVNAVENRSDKPYEPSSFNRGYKGTQKPVQTPSPEPALGPRAPSR